MNEMKFRTILIWIGWCVVVVSILSIAISIYSQILLQAELNKIADDRLLVPMTLRLIGSLFSIIESLALAALCFFAAHTISPLWIKHSPNVFD
ncbi:MAG: hypothetical protein COB56_00205 [Robiginitomaculum sp.]|nr:MAG: hypothetical protein COB56_00205 [Robiginitomaculum sp.]